MIVVSDTSPINYLVLIEEIETLHRLFGIVLVPPAVLSELTQPRTPPQVSAWLKASPPWFQVRAPLAVLESSGLGRGECEAISLAQELRADQLLMDDRAARAAALARGLSVTGTLNILVEAADRGFLDLARVMDRLRKTSFRASEPLLQEILRRHLEEKRDAPE